MFGYFKRRRRQRVRSQPLPPAWGEILQRNVPYSRMLSAGEQEQLRGDALILLDEKRFTGCGGLALTDEIRVTIAAGAAVLLLNRRTDYYPRMESIYVYPREYFVRNVWHLPAHVEVEGDSRLGESWYRGPVVLSWDETLKGSLNPRDGRNVVYHEFAHQLDSENGEMDGTPPLADRRMVAEWAEVFTREFDRLADDVDRRRRTVIDEYGATDPAEFFACATEAFFERSGPLRSRHAELYNLLAQYYCQDPAARWSGRDG